MEKKTNKTFAIVYIIMSILLATGVFFVANYFVKDKDAMVLTIWTFASFVICGGLSALITLIVGKIGSKKRQ